MGFDDLDSRVDSSRRDAASLYRNVSQANPQFDAGMGDDFEDFGNFGDSNTGGFDDFMSSNNDFGFGDTGNDFGMNAGASNGFGDMGFGNTGANGFGGNDFGFDGFGGSSNGFGFQNNGMPQQQMPQQSQSTEDKLAEAAVAFGKQSLTFFKDLMQSFKTFDAAQRSSTGRIALIASIIVAVIGVLLMIFGRFTAGSQILIGSLLSAGTGTILLCFGQSAVSAQMDNPQLDMGQTQPSLPSSEGANNFVDDFSWDNDSEATDDEVDIFAGDNEFSQDIPDTFSDDDWNDTATTNTVSTSDFDDSIFDDDDTDVFNSTDSGNISDDEDDDLPDWAVAPTSTTTSNEGTVSEDSVDRALNNLTDLPTHGLVDRSLLISKAMGVLPDINSTFADIIDISPDSDKFRNLDAIVQDSAAIFKPDKSTELPILESVQETECDIRLKIRRVKYIKNVDAYVDEIVKMLAIDERTGKLSNNIFGIGHAAGSSIYIKVRKDIVLKVGLKDIYNDKKAEILDTHMKMPVVLGIDAEGESVVRDFMSYHSLLIAGQPRSGKSWLVKNILWQLMLLNSPRDVQFYFFDPKAKISDFTTCLTPHVRGFVTDDNDIIQTLKYLIRVEGPRRKEVLGNYGVLDIKDYHAAEPNHDMPYLYLVIDEMVNLSTRMEAEVKKEFQNLLAACVTELPAAGIRLFIVPHYVKDNVIKKATSSMMPCRLSVRGNAEHVQDTCDVSPSAFPYKLAHEGDCCASLNGDAEPFFLHNNILAGSNDEIKNLFRYIAELWTRLEPTFYEGSVYAKQKEGLSIFDKGFSTQSVSQAAVTQNMPSSSTASASTSSVTQKPMPTRTLEIEHNLGTIERPQTKVERQQTGNQILNNPVDMVDLFDDDF